MHSELKVSRYFNSSIVIETSFCGWQTGSSDEVFRWERMDSRQCQDNYPGQVDIYNIYNIYT